MTFKSMCGLLVVAAVAAAGSLILPSQATAQAQQPQGLNILVVDIERIKRESSATVAVRKQIDAQRQTYLAELSQADTKLAQDLEDLRKQRDLLAPEAFEQQRQAVQKQRRDLERRRLSMARALDQAYGRALPDVSRVLDSIVTQVAQERAAALVMRRSAVLVTSSGLDVTAEVLGRLDEQLPAVTIQLPDLSAVSQTQ